MSVPAPIRTEERVRQLVTLDATGRAVVELPRRRPGQPAIVSRLIAAIPAGAGRLLEDSFERTVAADSWGTPDIGPTYAKLIDGGANQEYGVNGSQGTFFNADAVARQYHIMAPIGVADVDISAGAPAANAANAAAPRWIGLTGRVTTDGDPSGEGYLLAYNGATLSINRTSGNGFSDPPSFMNILASAATPLGGIGIHLRFVLDGPNLFGKVWIGNEPVDFDVSATDLSLQDTNGGVGVYWATNALIVAGSWDNLIADATVASPIWDAYIDSPDQLINIVDSSVVPVDRWIPAITNGQRINPSDRLVIVARDGIPTTQAVVTCSFVYST